MDLTDFIDDFEENDDHRRRKLAQEKSYEVLQNIDIEAYGERVGKVRSQGAFVGEAPSVFVGRSSYPNVKSGILSPLVDGDPSKLKTTNNWYNNNLGIGDILGRRTSLMNSEKEADTDVYDVWDGYVGVQREVALADEPTSVDIEISNANNIKPQLDSVSSPTGPKASADSATLTENPYIPKPIKKVENDDDWKSTEAMYYLYKKGFDVYKLKDILSTGTLGKKENRKLVPTRWSITAIDDTIGKKLREEVVKNNSINNTEIYYNSYIGNDYWIILTPGQWEFELVEVKEPESVWNPERSKVSLSSAYENYTGRTSYVNETAGAYYASRLGILENLSDMGRQAKCMIVRVVTDDYWAPTGVWQVRESVRNAFENDSVQVEDMSTAISEVVDNTPVDQQRLKRKSEMMTGLQRGLDWFN